MFSSHLQEVHLITEYYKMSAEYNFLKELLEGVLKDFSWKVSFSYKHN